MNKQSKKGFTLVELLVVIAILAILGTVSIVGYTSFTTKAKQSNAEQELIQIKTILLADWLDGYVGEANDGLAIAKASDGSKYTVTLKDATLDTTSEITGGAANFVKDNYYSKVTETSGVKSYGDPEKAESTTLGTSSDKYVKVTATKEANTLSALKYVLKDDAKDFQDKIYFVGAQSSDKKAWEITKVVYDCSNGFDATWTISGDAISSAKEDLSPITNMTYLSK